jgi:hypothetical protein
MFRKLLCFLGFCDIEADERPINGHLFGFCKHCGSRWEAVDDHLDGDQKWKPF